MGRQVQNCPVGELGGRGRGRRLGVGAREASDWGRGARRRGLQFPAGCRGHPKVTLACGSTAQATASSDNGEPAASPSFIIIQMRTWIGISFDW